MSSLLKSLDYVIDTQFIPAITDGHICSANERELLALPVKLGGLVIPIFSNSSTREYEHSKKASQQLCENIKKQTEKYTFDQKIANNTKREIVKSRENLQNERLEYLRSKMTKEQIKANDLTQMKGSSNWLTTLPLESENFVLNKREFVDASSLRYRWQLKRMPSICPCGKTYNVDHVMNCHTGGFVYQRHDKTRNTTAKMMNDVLVDVEIEPALIPLTGGQLQDNANLSDEARVDISVRSFLQEGQKAFFDVRVFNPFAQSYLNQNLQNTFVSNERGKKRAYN